MALINNLYIFVESEEYSSNVETSSHPVEKGIDITDHTRRWPGTLSLSGEIIGNKAETVRSKLEALHRKGSLVQYVGRRVFSQAQIVSFQASYSNRIMGGCSFTMELTEVRIAQSPYQKKGSGKTAPVTKAGTKQIQVNTGGKVYHTVKKGETAYSIGNKYKSHGSGMKFIMDNNPNAPKGKGDWNSLQIGTKLWVYTARKMGGSK